MIKPIITLALEGQRRDFQPGDTLAGDYRLEGIDPYDVAALELSVLWYTEGKGDEDLAVHYFERVEPRSGLVDFSQARRFSTSLPNSPLSYSGVIVKIRWCVRVRVFLPRGRELVIEEPFQLGSVPPSVAADGIKDEEKLEPAAQLEKASGLLP